MALDRKAFDALVARYEALEKSAPRAYRARVLAFALLGYAYLGFMIVLLIGMVALCAASVMVLKLLGVKLLLILVPFTWLVFKSLWVRLHAPQGIAVTRKQAPELFARLDKLRQSLHSQRFHRVLITDDFNAAVVQVPRLGVFGWHRNYLLLGMPLLKSLTPEQLDAVIAHEFGHLVGGHAAFGNWLYRLRATWGRLMEELAWAGNQGAWLFRGFFEWYVPRFNAYSFPLARADEYEADAMAARLASPQAAAEALTNVSVVGSYLGDKYWPGVFKQAETTPQPAFAPFAGFGEGLHEALASDDGRRWLDQALAEPTSTADTHPSLTDRLRAFGGSPTLVPPAPGKSADHLLGDLRVKLIAQMDERWQNTIIHDWRKRYDEVQEGRAELADLAKAAGERELTVEEALKRAHLEYDVGAGSEAAIEQMRALIARAPDHALAHFMLGARLLDMNDEAGVALVERAMELDADAKVPGNQALAAFHWRKGERERAYELSDAASAREEIERLAEAERNVVRVEDKLDPHGLDEATIAKLRDELKALGVVKAHLFRKRCKHLPEKPLWILGFRERRPFRFHNNERARVMQKRILEGDVTLPGPTIVLCTDGDNYRFRRKFRWRKWARV